MEVVKFQYTIKKDIVLEPEIIRIEEDQKILSKELKMFHQIEIIKKDHLNAVSMVEGKDIQKEEEHLIHLILLTALFVMMSIIKDVELTHQVDINSKHFQQEEALYRLAVKAV